MAHWFRLLPVLLILGPSGASLSAAAPDDGGGPAAPATRPARSAALKAEADGPLVAGFPVQLGLTITNTGPETFYYWCGGPGRYPSASPFIAVVTDAAGKTRTYPLNNGQYEIGSGIGYPIKDVQTLPAAFDPLPAGTYTLKVTGRALATFEDGKRTEYWPAMSAGPMTITVKDDAHAFAAARQALLGRMQQEPFARHVAETYGFASVVGEWLDQLLNDDPEVASRVVVRLQGVRRLPAGRDDVLPKAAAKQANSVAPDRNLLRSIAIVARNLKTDEALDAVILIARADVATSAQNGVIGDLAGFPQPRAADVLMEFAGQKDSPAYWPAVAALAARRNPAVLPTLLDALKGPTARRRVFAVQALGGYRDDVAARAAVAAATQDADPDVRAAAEQALATEAE